MLRLLELFGGIGSPRKALERLGIDLKVVDYVEIDKYAVASYNSIYGENFEPQDITKWDKQIEVDMIFHGSPCQDFSIAGKQQGGEEGSGTRSSLLYETLRIVEKLKPKYVLWENVKNVISKKHRQVFDDYLNKMEQLGYTNYYQVLNAKDYGIPQNRERVFTVSILGNEKYEFPKENIQECEVINPLKDISGKSWQFEQNVYSENSILRSLKAGGGSGNIPKVIEHFEFPPKQYLKLRLKDMLEDEVDKKYYLSDKMLNYVLASGTKNYYYKPEINLEIARPLSTEQNKRAGTTNYVSKNCIQIGQLDIKGQDKGVVMNDLRIRKLTPKECWRLMGFDDEDFDKASKVNSNCQLYKQAGNSIVVNVLLVIFKNLLKEE